METPLDNSSPLVTKLSILKAHVAAGRKHDALKLAAGWGKRGLGGGAHAEAITKAWAAMSNPGFYIDIGQDPVAIIDAGFAAIKERYGI